MVLVLSPFVSWAEPPAATEYPSLADVSKVQKTGSKDVAVIVAVEQYLMLPHVAGAIRNGNDWEVYFRQGLGVPKVHYLANTRATKEQMQRFAKLAAKDVEPGGTLWFVFIGHGGPAAGGTDGLLIGADAQQDTDSLNARGLSQQALLDLLNQGKQEQTVLVVDACFSGRAGDGAALVAAQPVVPVNLQPTLAKTKTVVLSAAQATEFAGPLPGAERPAFSYLLLGGLRGWAKEGKGDVTAEEALWYTQRVLRGIPGRFDQTPTLLGDGGLVLARGAGERDPGIEDMMRGILRGSGDSPQVAAKPCPSGQERSIDTASQCCWPGQSWSRSRSQCVGVPTACPEGTRAQGEGCAVAPRLVATSEPKRRFVTPPSYESLSEAGPGLSRLDWEAADLTPSELRSMRAKLEAKNGKMIAQIDRLLAITLEGPQQASFYFQKAELNWEMASMAHLDAFMEFRRCTESKKSGCKEPRQDHTATLKLFEEVLRRYPNYARIDEVLFRIGQIHVAEGKGTAAVALFQRVIKNHPKSQYLASSHLALADFFMKGKTLAAASDNYKSALRHDAFGGYIRYQLGWIAHATGEPDEAKMHWAKAIDEAKTPALKKRIRDDIPR